MSDDNEEECKLSLELCLGVSSSLDTSPLNPDSSSCQIIPKFSDSGNQFEIGESTSARRRKTEEVISEGGGVNSNSIPVDLLLDITKELPVKALLRFLSVSKFWESTIRSQKFRDSYLVRSLTQPPQRKGLLFTFACEKECFVFSSSRPEKSDEESSYTSVANYIMTCHSQSPVTITPSVHGLICHGPASKLVVYNPCTRQKVELPRINLVGRGKIISHYIGYDPLGSDYKVLCATIGRAEIGNERGLAEEIRVLTLTRENEHPWRMVQDVPPHSPTSDEMCIDGVLYYGAFTGADLTEPSIMRFDVKSEAFDLIAGPENAGSKFLSPHSKLTSYQEKLAVIFMEEDQVVVRWVLQDDEWSKTSFDLPSRTGFTTDLHLGLFSSTNAGEIILAPVFLRTPTLRALYYDPKKESFRKIEIDGITQDSIPHQVGDWWYCRTISVFPYQVENLLFLEAKRDD